MKYFSLIIATLASLFIRAQNTNNLYEGSPVFHGAKITGNFPNTEFLFTVPATGERPITFTAENLPTGLNINASNGIIRGNVAERGSYTVKIIATNAKGKTEENLKIEIGDKLCLTPPMGWNSWNVFTNTLDEKLVIEIADAMVSTGMRDLGYQYINMDDYWHATSRDADGKPVADPVKFPHGIKWLADYVHSKGLKLGIYSDAGDKTCGKCFGGFQYEEIDAKTYAEWGIDLLKYDFCFVPWKKKEAIARYTKMGTALISSGRSIVYSICNWGLFKPWEWGESVGGNYWRTTPDIFDTWRGGIPFMMSTMRIIKKQNKILQYGKQGHWNDPDMLIVGNYGKGKATGRNGMFKGMTDIQYQSHLSLWAIMNAPLLASCDLRNMNEPTKNILMNETLVSINQDMLGAQAQLVRAKNKIWIYKKSLENGGIAVAFFNPTKKKRHFKFIEKEYTDIEHPLNTTSGYIFKQERFTGGGPDIEIEPHETIVIKLTQIE